MHALNEIIVSPCDHAQLKMTSAGFKCLSSGEEFIVEDDVLDLIPKAFKNDKKVKAWAKKQALYTRRSEKITKKESQAKSERYINYHDEFLNSFCSLRGRILDVGCGPMMHNFKCLKGSLDIENYYGIEPLANLSADNPNCFKAVGEYLPFPDNSFDTVFSISVLDHVIYPKKVLAEIHRTLRPGGIIYTSLPSRHLTWKTELVKTLFPQFRSATHVVEFNHQKLYNFLTRAGFRGPQHNNPSSHPKICFSRQQN